MIYEPISKIFYKNRELYKQKYKMRFESESACVLDFWIGKDQAFFITDMEMLRLTEGIMGLNTEIQKVYDTLPGIAKSAFLKESLIKEVMITNDIEGVHSSRQEITYAMQNQDKKNVRFSGLVNKYLMLLSDKEIPLNTNADIRKLYDEIVLNEIDPADQPDGEYYRQKSVSVVSATETTKHTGVYPESKINSCMEKALYVLKDERLPILVQVAVFHYLFGYIHPFYDGNGRMDRFISSYLLSTALQKSVALRLSYSIKNKKNEYYKAFDLCNNKLNKGDITPFIFLFFDIIKDTEVELYELLMEYRERMDYCFRIADDFKYDRIWHKDLANVLIQNAVFSNKGVSMEELLNVLKKSDYTIRVGMKALGSMGIPIHKQKESRKILYRLDLKAFEHMGDEI